MFEEFEILGLISLNSRKFILPIIGVILPKDRILRSPSFWLVINLRFYRLEEALVLFQYLFLLRFLVGAFS